METCDGTKKLFKDLSKWELLNLKVPTVLEIPDRLSVEFGISSAFLQGAMKRYGIQSVGLGPLERQYDIQKPIQYMVASTRHYSWPKSGGKHHPFLNGCTGVNGRQRSLVSVLTT